MSLFLIISFSFETEGTEASPGTRVVKFSSVVLLGGMISTLSEKTINPFGYKGCKGIQMTKTCQSGFHNMTLTKLKQLIYVCVDISEILLEACPTFVLFF